MTDIQNIEDFLALVRAGSFTRAADARNVSQPAFTRRIKMLEDEIGAPLFDRSVSPIALTEAGARFLIHAQNLSRTYRQALDDARAAHSHLKNPVRVAAPHTLALTVFPRLCKAALRCRPDINVALTGQRTEACLADLRDHHADLALIHAAPEETKMLRQSGYDVLKVETDALLPVIAPHAMAQKNRLLSYTPEVALGAYVRQKLGEKAQASLQSVFESPSSEVLKAMALAGHGLAFLPRLLIEDDMKDGFLVTPSGKWPSVPLDVLLLKMPSMAHADALSLWQASVAPLSPCAKTE